MTEWEVVGVIATLVGLMAVILGASSGLVKAITKLDTTVAIFNEQNTKDHECIKDDIAREVSLAHQARDKYENQLSEHGKQLTDHEARIRVIERESE